MCNVAHVGHTLDELRINGGVNITGLEWTCGKEKGIFEPHEDDLGKWFTYGNKTILTVPEEVWLMPGKLPDEIAQYLVPKLCPNGQMDTPPYPFGFEIDPTALSARKINTHDKCYGNPIPHIRGRRRGVIKLPNMEVLTWGNEWTE